MTDRVSRAEAARTLEINRSTLTRWCKKHPALLDENNLVSIEEIRIHRDTVINPKLQTKTPGKTVSPQPAQSTLNDHRSRREKALADDAELNLAARLGNTLRRDEVEASLAEAAELMTQTAGQLTRDRAEALSRIEDERAMEAALNEMMADLMSKTVAALLVAAQGDADKDAA